jgi:hypothetical protein
LKPSNRSAKEWFTWYSVSLGLSIAGTYLAYSDALGSKAWQCWTSPTAWKRDSALAVVATALVIFLLWNMGTFAIGRKTPKTLFIPSNFRLYEWLLLGTAGLLLLVLNFLVLPGIFRADLHAKLSVLAASPGCSDLSKVFADDYRQIVRPYIPYVLNPLGLWVGIVMPIFLQLIRSVFKDLRVWRINRARLDSYVSKAKRVGDTNGTSIFNGLVISLQNYVVALKAIAEEYVPILLGVSLILLYEQITPTVATTTSFSVDLGKFAVWLLLGPALVTCIVIVALGYQRATQRTEVALKALARNPSSAADSDLVKRIAETRSKLIWDQSPAAFILSVAKSATISVPLLLAIIAYVFHLHNDGWFAMFVPKIVMDFIHNLYQ